MTIEDVAEQVRKILERWRADPGYQIPRLIFSAPTVHESIVQYPVKLVYESKQGRMESLNLQLGDADLERIEKTWAEWPETHLAYERWAQGQVHHELTEIPPGTEWVSCSERPNARVQVPAGAWVPEFEYGEVVQVDQPGNDNHGREGPVWSVPDYEGDTAEVWFEDGIREYEVKQLIPAGRAYDRDAMDKLPNIRPGEIVSGMAEIESPRPFYPHGIKPRR